MTASPEASRPQPHERLAGSLMRLLDERDFDPLAQRITLLSFRTTPLRLNLYSAVLDWVLDQIVETARFRVGGAPGAAMTLSITGEDGRRVRESELAQPWPQLLDAVRLRLAPGTDTPEDAPRTSTATTDRQTRAELLLTALTWLDDLLTVSGHHPAESAHGAARVDGVLCVIDGERL